jgi:hypothetical protein
MINHKVLQVAVDYMRTIGRSHKRQDTSEIVAKREWGKAIADQYQYYMNHPELWYSLQTMTDYYAFCQELAWQYDAVVRFGQLTVEPWLDDGQPYDTSDELREDVWGNNHMYFFLTDAGFGEGDQHKDHPLLRPTGVMVSGKSFCYNDLFRVVHDYFGHCLQDNTFSASGETRAWLEHLNMFVSEGARKVLSTEAQGQTCWFNFGPHLRREDNSLPKRRDSDFVPMRDRPYADQIVATLDPALFQPLANV